MPCHAVAALPAAVGQWWSPAHVCVGLTDPAHCCAPWLLCQSPLSPTGKIAMWIYRKPAHRNITQSDRIEWKAAWCLLSCSYCPLAEHTLAGTSAAPLCSCEAGSADPAHRQAPVWLLRIPPCRVLLAGGVWVHGECRWECPTSSAEAPQLVWPVPCGFLSGVLSTSTALLLLCSQQEV